MLGLALAIGAAVPAQAALTPTIDVFPSSDPPSSESGPFSIAAGSDGQLWFTNFNGHGIGRMSVGGRLTLQAPLPVTQYPEGIAAGSDGAMWFVSQGAPNTVNRIDEAGNVLSKELAVPLANPTHITAGPQGSLWFTESGGKAIGRIPAAAPLAVPEETRATADSPNAIAAGSDGNLWFTQYSASDIGRMTPSGDVHLLPAAERDRKPGGDNRRALTALSGTRRSTRRRSSGSQPTAPSSRSRCRKKRSPTKSRPVPTARCGSRRATRSTG